MLDLKFVRSHASINSFPDTAIPNFTLITGPNGAGKTHLLQAILQGNIATSLAPNQSLPDPNQIRFFDWTNMTPQDGGFFSSENIRNERVNLFNLFSNMKQNPNYVEPLRVVARKFGFGGEYLNNPSKVLGLSQSTIVELAGGDQKAAELRTQIEAELSAVETNILNYVDVNSRIQLKLIADAANKRIYDLTERDILSPTIPTWGQSDIFQHSFAKLFVAYRDVKLANQLAQLRATKGGDAEFLSDEQFVQRHGPAPWDFVNNSLKVAGLDFEISKPTEDDYTPFQPTLSKRSTGIAIPFSALSSGEKVLMSFAFCVYYSNDRRQLSARPKILLLDEIDAPLHPSMSRSVIDTITKVLVGSFDIKIIATTHSPSTVALAPEESIYTMRPSEAGLHKSSKAAALNILTVGVPTLAISYDGRRQIFVESPIDAKIYDALYKILRPKIASDRSLEFVATGVRTRGKGDENTGCDVVKRLVAELSSAGNISVFGLLDWDGRHDPSGRIAVIGHRSRNGLENIILDPLLLGLTICRAFPEKNQSVGIPDGTSYLELIVRHRSRFQEMANFVTAAVLGSQPDTTSDSTYVGGLILKIDSRYFTTDDHALEGKVLAAFPFLHSITRNQGGKLVEHVISNVLADNPDLMPVEVKQVIEDLLERPAHS